MSVCTVFLESVRTGWIFTRKTGESIYLHIKRRVKPKPAEEEQEVSTWGKWEELGV